MKIYIVYWITKDKHEPVFEEIKKIFLDEKRANELACNLNFAHPNLNHWVEEYEVEE